MPTSYNKVTFNGLPVLSPAAVARSLRSANLDVPPDIWLANHFICPLGSPARGHLLMAKVHLDQINFNLTNHTLRIHTPPLDPVEHKNLIIVPGKTRRIGKGLSTNANALYLVEIADRSWFGANPYFNCEIRTSQDAANNIFNTNQELFNIPAGLYPGEYYEESRQIISLSGTRQNWTWESMAKCLWPSFLGTKPTTVLPYSPDGAPVGFDLRTMPHLQAYSGVLGRLGCSLRYISSTGGYDVVRLGDPDLALAYAIQQLPCRQLEDDRFLGNNLLRPAGVRVCFDVRATQPGSENTYPKEDNWRVNSVYQHEVARTPTAEFPIASALSSIFHTIWDDMKAEMDPFSGTITNLAALTARAQERSDRFFDQLGETGEYAQRRFSGAANISTGPQCRGVAWKEEVDGSWTTEIVNHPALAYSAGGKGELVGNSMKIIRGNERAPEYMMPYEVFVGRVEDDPDADGWQTVVERRLNPSDNSISDGVTFKAKDVNA